MKQVLFFVFNILLTVVIISCNSKNGKLKEETSKVRDDFGKVIAVIDGDTYDILIQGNQTIRIRMEGIDAPEKGMPFYQKSKKYLSELCFGKYVKIDIQDTDSNGRKIAYTYLYDGTELSHEMIKAGMAWHFKTYNNDVDLATLEEEARLQKLGLWVDPSPMPPWENRSLHRNGISTKDSFDIKEGQQ